MKQSYCAVMFTSDPWQSGEDVKPVIEDIGQRSHVLGCQMSNVSDSLSEATTGAVSDNVSQRDNSRAKDNLTFIMAHCQIYFTVI